MKIISRENGIEYKKYASILVIYNKQEKIKEYNLTQICKDNNLKYDYIYAIYYKKDCIVIHLDNGVLYINNSGVKKVGDFTYNRYSACHFFFNSEECIFGELVYDYSSKLDEDEDEDNWMNIKYILWKGEEIFREYELFKQKNMKEKIFDVLIEEGMKLEIFYFDDINPENFIIIDYFHPTYHYDYHISKESVKTLMEKEMELLEEIKKENDIDINHYKLNIFRKDKERISLKFEYLYPMIQTDDIYRSFVRFKYLKELGILIEEYFHRNESCFLILRYEEEDFKIRHKILLKSYKFYFDEEQQKEYYNIQKKFESIEGDKNIFIQTRNEDDEDKTGERGSQDYLDITVNQYFEYEEYFCIVMYNTHCSYNQLLILNKTFDKNESLIFDSKWKVIKFEGNKIYFNKGIVEIN